MATVTVTANLKSIGGIPDNAVFTFRSPAPRLAEDGSIVTTKWDRVAPVDGILTKELEPGPCVVSWTGSNPLSIVIPDEDSDLWSLLAVAVGVPPTTPQGILLAAIAAYLADHPVSDWDDIPNKPAVIATGADQAAARASIGAGTSSLALGTSGSTAAAGNDSRLSDTRTPTDGSVTTAKIVDANVSLAKLSSGVQTSLGKADTAYQAPAVVGAGSTQLAARGAIDAAPRTAARSLRVAGKVKGANIVPKPTTTGGSGPAAIWVEWDWDNWVRPQVDRAITLGLNAIRVIGGSQAIFVDYNPSIPKISQATYDSRWSQLAEYCLEKGMYLYPGLIEHWTYKYVSGTFQGTGPWDWADADVAESVTTTAAVLARYPNVIGFDVFQEAQGAAFETGDANGWGVSDALALYAQIREVAPGIPLTTSMSGANSSATDGFDEFWSATAEQKTSYRLWTSAGGADFVDLHLYTFQEADLNPAKLDFILKKTQLPLVVGEYGDSQDQTLDHRASLYRGVSRVHNRPGVLGSFLWALADQSGTTAGKFGIWDNTGFSQTTLGVLTGNTPLSTTSGQRTEMTNVLPSFNVADKPLPDYGRQPNLINGLQTRPMNSLTRWSGDSNTSVFGSARGLEIRPISNAVTINASLASAYRVPVQSGVYYRFDCELASDTSGRTINLMFSWYDSSNTFVSNTSAVVATTPGPRGTVRLSIVDTPPSTAVLGMPIIRILSTVSTSEHYWVLSNPPPYMGQM